MVVLVLLIPGDVLAAEFAFDRIDVYINLENNYQEYDITLTPAEEGLEYLDFSPMGPLEAVSASGKALRTEARGDSVRVFFEDSLKKGETYSFTMRIEGTEVKTLDDFLLFNKALVFPKAVESLTLMVELPKGIFPELKSHGAVCEEDCQCSQGGLCICEDCSTCITCRLSPEGNFATQPPDDIIIDEEGLILIWKRSLRANERFDIDLLIPKKKSRMKWYLLGGAFIAGIFTSGFFIAKRKRESEVAQVFLNPDEKCVVDYIKDHGGEVLQQDIWRAEEVCYSRPKVSRIIADLEERGIIKREPYKKTFKVKLSI